MKKLAVALALLAAAVAPAAQAQDGAAYYGLSIGQMDYSETLFDSEFSDSGSAWHLMVSYHFNRYLAVEGSYGQSDTIRGTVVFPGLLPGQQDEVTLSSEFGKILTVRLMGVLPLDNFKLMAGLGYADLEIDQELLVNGVSVASGEASGNEPSYFVGAQYDWDRFAMRLGYEKYDIDDVDAEETSITFFYKL